MSERVVVDIAGAIGASRYNGGWLKTVTGLDKSVSNGYSLLGSFLTGSGLRSLEPGLYLDCDISGSRKNQTHHYTLVEVTPEATVNTLAESRGLSGYTRGKTGHDWAIRLWPAIEDWFSKQPCAPETEPVLTSKDRLCEQCAALMVVLVEIDRLLHLSQPGEALALAEKTIKSYTE